MRFAFCYFYGVTVLLWLKFLKYLQCCTGEWQHEGKCFVLWRAGIDFFSQHFPLGILADYSHIWIWTIVVMSLPVVCNCYLSTDWSYGLRTYHSNCTSYYLMRNLVVVRGAGSLMIWTDLFSYAQTNVLFLTVLLLTLCSYFKFFL